MQRETQLNTNSALFHTNVGNYLKRFEKSRLYGVDEFVLPSPAICSLTFISSFIIKDDPLNTNLRLNSGTPFSPLQKEKQLTYVINLTSWILEN